MPIVGIEQPDGTIHLQATCESCGKPLVRTGEYGMDCEDQCAEKEFKQMFGDRKPNDVLDEFINPFLDLLTPRK
jgi:hypothetical protein